MANTELNGYVCTLLLMELIHHRTFFEQLEEKAKAKKTTLEHEYLLYYKQLYECIDEPKVKEQISKQFIPYQPDIIERINSVIVDLLVKVQEYEKMVRSNHKRK